jgi:hypothetical protein
MEVRYALLDSRRYPAMYLSYQLPLSLSLSLSLSRSLSLKLSRGCRARFFLACLRRRRNYEIDPESTRCPGGTSRIATIDGRFHFRLAVPRKMLAHERDAPPRGVTFPRGAFPS